MKRFIPIIFIALMGIFTVSCNGGDDDNDPVVIGDAPAFSATEIPAGSSILIENSPASSALTLETDGNFELEVIDGNYYLKANTMGEAEVTVTNNEGISTTDTISSWGVLLDESGVDYQGIVYDGDSIGNNSYTSSSAVAGDIIIPRYIEQDGVQTDLTSVPDDAFYNNDNITSVSFAKGSKVTRLQYLVFSECENLTTVDLSNCTELEIIRKAAFSFSSKITSIDFSNCSNLKYIGTAAFMENSAMEAIGLEDLKALEYIDYSAFSYCKEVKVIDLSNSPKLQVIADNAFDYNTLEAVMLSSEEVRFGNNVFNSDAIYNIYGVLGSNTERNALAEGYNFADINAWN